MEKTLFLLDSYALAFRMFYAFSKAPLVNSAGRDVSMVHGYWGTVLRLLAKYEPTHFAIVKDVGKPTFRHELYPAYKANRGPMPEEMAAQMPLLEEALSASGLPVLAEEGFEADDVMAAVALAAERAGFARVVLVTKDKDMAQAVTGVVHLLHLEKGADGIDFGPGEVVAKYGVPPEQIRDYLALMGDTSDNVPGVPKVGPKTAVELLRTFENIDNLYARLGEVAKKGLHKTLEENRESAFLSRELVTLQRERGFSGTLDELEFRGLSGRLGDFFAENELKSLMNLLGKVKSLESPESVAAEPEVLPEYVLVNTPAKLAALKGETDSATVVSLDTETDGLDQMACKLVGICVSLGEERGYYLPIGHTDDMGLPLGNLPFECVSAWFKELWARPGIEWVFHNAKFDLHVLTRAFSLTTLPEKLCDSLIAAWMLAPGERGLGLDEQVHRELNHVMIPIESLIGRGQNQISFARVPLKEAADYGAEDAVFTLRLWRRLLPKLRENGYEKFFLETEMPFLRVLFGMECTGVAIDAAKLAALAKEMEGKIALLESQVYEAAGGEFNIGSTKQLAEVLFDKLELPQVKKRSTDVAVLEELARIAPHPIVFSVMNYREQKKLLNTYVNVLPTLVNGATGRIHTNFLQWGTATGRLSSKEPNLQNIPVRSDDGKKIRASFVPGNPENVILAVDYSQIELRMLAHLSGDENLVRAYNSGADIHAQTAAAIYGVAPEAVTSDMRRDAKVVNFGVLYGMSAFRLSKDLNVTVREAQAFIDGYFTLYSGVEKFSEDTVKFARDNGYVVTLSGRRRYIPGITSGDRMERKMAERMAINTPVQGSSADLIKLAMINIAGRIRRENLPLKMMLQVHDELVFECPRERAEELGQVVKREMEGAMTLKVPLVASVGYGADWLEAH